MRLFPAVTEVRADSCGLGGKVAVQVTSGGDQSCSGSLSDWSFVTCEIGDVLYVSPQGCQLETGLLNKGSTCIGQQALEYRFQFIRAPHAYSATYDLKVTW